MASFISRLAHAWNAFTNKESSKEPPTVAGGMVSYGGRIDRTRLTFSNEQSIISSIFTRLGMDCAGLDMKHVRVDEQGRYTGTIDSGLNNCLTIEANIDQGARAFRQDIVMTMLDKGVAAIVPVDTTADPAATGAYDIQTMRVGEVVAWFPYHVRVRVYNEVRGMRQDITLPKSLVAIVENPLYAVMNERITTLQRLIRKLNLLDVVDEQSSSGKLDLIIQLPYVIKSEARRDQAKQRRADIQFQLKDSQYGIAYTDATEKITQLNRPAENNLLAQVQYLTSLLYNQLGLTEDVMNGTADDKTMLNYFNRTIEPLVEAITEAMTRTFLTKTARTQRQRVSYFRDPFKLVPMEVLAKVADVFIRGQIAAPNDIRSAIGWIPSTDPVANKLQNPSMPPPPQDNPAPSGPTQLQLVKGNGGNSQNGS
jgi:hypothetical protein